MRDAETPPEQMEPVISSNETATFCDETKPFYDDNNDVSELDNALVEETMDNDSDPSFKGGSDHGGSSEYLLLIQKSILLYVFWNNIQSIK